MSEKQWLLITVAVILNIIIFGALLGDASAERPSPPTPTWTPHPTFTPKPFATATAIRMPTQSVPPTRALGAVPTPQAHIVREGETLESIAQAYGVSVYVLKVLNRIADNEVLYEGQKLLIPASD